MKKVLLLLFLLPLIFLDTYGQQKTPRERSIEVSAVTSSSPPSITLSWIQNNTEEDIKIYRKVGNTSAPWGDPIATLPGTATSYTDANVQVGVAYEYGIWKKEHEVLEWNITVPNGTPLNFTINNVDGNGLCCVYGPGWYEVSSCGSVHAYGSEFGFSETTNFTPCNGGGGNTEVKIRLNPDVFTHQTYWNLTGAGNGVNYGTSGPPYTFLTRKPTFGFIYAGIQVPEIEQHGTLLLAVDDSYLGPLASEIARLELDLIKEGWKVVRQPISSSLSVTQVKAILQQQYNTIPDLRTVFILGNLAVPYSGNIYPDSHVTHQGAWPADVFYAEMNGTWTDNVVSNSGAFLSANHNQPGDGKYDQSFIPTAVELELGRLDLSDMFMSPNDEITLTRNYLNKNHEFRTKQFVPERRGLIDDNIQHVLGAPASTAWRGFTAMFGSGNVHTTDYFGTLSGSSYLWSYGCGGGSHHSSAGIGVNTDFVNSNLQTTFTALFGSQFGDWDNANNFLRAPLISGKTLTSCYAGNPNWVFHHMALGYHIGYSTIRTQNSTLNDYLEGPQLVHSTLLGDPSLKLFAVKAAESLTMAEQAGGVVLNWNAPSGESVSGYNVYRASTLYGEFTKLNTSPVTGTTFTDDNPLVGNNVYMVRARKLEQTASGSYYNLAPGVVDSISATGNPGAQTITFLPIEDKFTTDVPFALDASASSGLTVTLQVISGPATIMGNIITLTGATGTVVVQATQPGDGFYDPATPVNQGFEVNTPPVPDPQSISFPAITDKTVADGPFNLNATASSGLAVSYEVISGPASVDGNTVTLDGTIGTVVVQASQAGDPYWNPATPVNQSFDVLPANQTINFPSLPNVLNTSAPFVVEATASSGLPVSFNIVSGPATINGNTITLTGALGTVIVKATQEGNTNYNAATEVNRSFEVFDAASNATNLSLSLSSDPSTLNIWNNMTITLTVENTGVLAATGITVDVPIPKSEGLVQAGDPDIPTGHSLNYINEELSQWVIPSLAPNTETSLTISLFVIQDDNPVVYYSQIIAASPVDLNSTPGNNAGPVPTEDDEAVMTIYPPGGGPQDQTITFGTLADKLTTDPDFNVSATANSGLPVSFNIVSGPATIDGNTISLTGAEGTVTVRASQAGDSAYNPATPVDQSFEVTAPSLQDQTITFGPLADKLTTDPDFDVTATSSSGLAVSFNIVSGPATIDGNTITLTGAVGTVVVRASQAGDSEYNPATPVDQSFEVTAPSLQDQTITFGPLADKLTTDPDFDVTATSSSGLAVSFNIVSGPATIDGNTITLTGAVGTVVVRASQAGDSEYNPATPVDQSFNVTTPSLQDQTITFGPLADKLTTDPDFDVTATSSSGLAVSFNIVSGPATIDGNTITLTGAVGTVVVRASQAGDSQYNPATPVDQSFEVTAPALQDQTITFGPLADKLTTDPDFDVTATSSSGLAVSFNIVSGPATIDGNTITLTGAVGTVVVRASQAGDSEYNPATPVDQSFNVTAPALQDQTITFGPLADKLTTDPDFDVTATSSSGLAVSFNIVSGPATIDGNTITLTGSVGTVVVRASQAGDSEYNPATPVDQSFNVTAPALQDQTIDFPAIADVTTLSGPFNISATASSGLPVSFNIISGPATIDGNTITLTGAVGAVLVRASQAGDSQYNPAQAVDQTFQVSTPPTDGIDLELMVVPSPPNLVIWNSLTLTFTVTNSGSEAASGITVAVPIPKSEGLVVAGGTTLPPGQSLNYISDELSHWVIPSLGAGESTSFDLGLFVIQDQVPVNYFSQVLVASPDDVDSTPGNNAGTTPTEDDEVLVVLAPPGSGPLDQTISTVPISDKLSTDGPFDVTASASSGLPVNIEVSSGPATIDGNTIILTGQEGTVNLTFSQAGNASYNPAPNAFDSFEVTAPNLNPMLSISAPTEGATIIGTSVVVDYSLSNVTLGQDVLSLTLDNGTPVVLPAASGQHTFSGLAFGAHTLAAKILDNTQNSYSNPEASATVNFTTEEETDGGDPPSGYCSSAGNMPWQEWIGNVTFGTINNSTFKDLYGDYTDLSTNVVKGNSYAISVLPEFSWLEYDEYIRVWIDYNRDGDFGEANELVFEGHGITELTGTVDIPLSASNGTTRMRVSMKNGSYADPCETFDLGEVEDYTVNILGGSSLIRAENTVAQGIRANYELSIYPNPTKGEVWVDMNQLIGQDVDLVVFNAQGSRVYFSSYQKVEVPLLRLDLSQQATGLYLMRFRLNDNTILTKKVFIQK